MSFLSKSSKFCLSKVLVPYEYPRRKLEREKTEQRGRGGPNVGESRCLTVGRNVKLLEQFNFLVCQDASYSEVTKTCICQQTAEDNFQQHCVQSKERHSKYLIKPLEPEWSTDFFVSHDFASWTLQNISPVTFSGKMMCYPEQAYLSGLRKLICIVALSKTYETIPFVRPVLGLVLCVLGSVLPKRTKI